MAAKENDELFELIHALNPAERRAFKLYFERNAQSDVTKYIKVFDAIAQMEVWDKSKLEKKFKGDSTITYYSKTKALLLEAIYESLLQNNTTVLVYNEIQYGLNKIRLLLRKGLQDTASKYVEKYKTLGYAAGQFPLVFEILGVEEDIYNTKVKDTTNILDETDVVLEYIKEEQFFNRKNRAVYQYYIQYGTRLPDDVKLKVRALQEEINKTPHSPASFLSMVKKHSSVALAYHIMQENDEAVNAMLEYLKLYFQTPEEFQRDRKKEVIRQMNNMLSYAFHKRDFTYYSGVGDVVRNYMQNIPGEETAKLEVEMSMLFGKISLTHDYSIFEQALDYIESSKTNLVQTHVVRRGDYTFNIALLYTKIHRIDDSLRWLQYFFDIPNIEGRNYVFVYAKILEILIHWKLHSQDLIDSRTLSLKRYLTKKGKLGEFEKVLISFITSSNINNTTKGFQRSLKNFKENLAQLDKTKYAGIVENYNDLLEWFVEPE
ncbi:MAG: hypothetical protein K1X91_01855 [Bacteriodetes bacterium]|nr:hypothetical protein [Bacteroidota bacterium]